MRGARPRRRAIGCNSALRGRRYRGRHHRSRHLHSFAPRSRVSVFRRARARRRMARRSPRARWTPRRRIPHRDGLRGTRHGAVPHAFATRPCRVDMGAGRRCARSCAGRHRARRPPRGHARPARSSRSTGRRFTPTFARRCFAWRSFAQSPRRRPAQLLDASAGQALRSRLAKRRLEPRGNTRVGEAGPRGPEEASPAGVVRSAVHDAHVSQ